LVTLIPSDPFFTVLREAPEWHDIIWFDEFPNRAVLPAFHPGRIPPSMRHGAIISTI
jgi:hypothetical protein